MSRTAAAWLAWSLCGLCVALIALALFFDFLTGDVPVRPQERLGPTLAIVTGALSLVYPTVGALIASRLPRNPIGWIFCGAGLIYTAQRFAVAYADYTLLKNLALPGGEYVAWFSTLIGFAGPVLTGIFLMLLFPDGRLPSHRWRIVAWAAIFGATLAALGDAFMPTHLRTHSYVDNPFGVVGTIGGRLTTYDLLGSSTVLGILLLATSSLAALLSLIVRLHRARGDERQQLKWFLYAAVPAVVALSPALLDDFLFNLTRDFLLFNIPGSAYNYDVIVSWDFLTYSIYVAVFAALLVPVCTYIAILKHHLYDIDIIINRTLVYGSLTVVIAGIFEAVDAVVHHLLLTLTHQKSILSVIIAALAIAALFDPIKHRIKRFVDRRIFGEEQGGKSEQP